MLYLLEDRDYVKIGYSKDVNERIKAHKTSNCYVKLIGTKPGTRKDEKELHKICEQYRYSTEGFYNVPEVKDAFGNYNSVLEKEILLIKKFAVDRGVYFFSKGELMPFGDDMYNLLDKYSKMYTEVSEQNLQNGLTYVYNQQDLANALDVISGKRKLKGLERFKHRYEILPNMFVEIDVQKELENAFENPPQSEDVFIILTQLQESFKTLYPKKNVTYDISYCGDSKFEITKTKFSSED